MSTLSQSTVSLRDNLILQSLNRPDFEQMVLSTDYGFNTIQQIQSLINKGKTRKSADMKKLIPSIGNTSISNKVSSVAQSGANLIVTFVNTPENRFRLKDVVADKNLIKGRVVAVTSTTIEIETYNPAVTLSSGTHFTAGSVVSKFWDASGNHKSNGKDSLTIVPGDDYAVLCKMRDSLQMLPTDKIKSEVMFNGKYWYASQQKMLMQRFSKMREYRWVFDERVYQATSSIEGEFNGMGGIYWTAKQNGGTYMPLTSSITETDLQDFILSLKAKKAATSRKILLLVGSEALASMQTNIFKGYIQNTGSNNTLGGAGVKGINSFSYAFAGVELEIAEYSLFNDRKLFGSDVHGVTGRPRMESSVIALDMTTIPSADGSEDFQPLTRYTYEGAPDFYMGFESGLGLFDSQYNSIQNNSFNPSQSDLDASTWHLWCFEGLYCMPESVGFIELI